MARVRQLLAPHFTRLARASRKVKLATKWMEADNVSTELLSDLVQQRRSIDGRKQLYRKIHIDAFHSPGQPLRQQPQASCSLWILCSRHDFATLDG